MIWRFLHIEFVIKLRVKEDSSNNQIPLLNVTNQSGACVHNITTSLVFHERGARDQYLNFSQSEDLMSETLEVMGSNIFLLRKQIWNSKSTRHST